MTVQWTMFINLGIISIGLLIATWIRARVRFFQRYLIPNPILAGFILLPLYNFVFPRLGLTSVNLGEMAYHLLSLSFVALSLKAPPRKKPGKGRIFGTTLSVLNQFAVQGLIGLLLTFFFIKTIMPDLFPSFGYLLPLGFAQGPGQAYSIGESWKAFGVEGAGSIGLTFAAIGFILCSFGGVFIINYGIKRKWIAPEKVEFLTDKDVRPGIHSRGAKLPIGGLSDNRNRSHRFPDSEPGRGACRILYRISRPDRSGIPSFFHRSYRGTACRNFLGIEFYICRPGGAASETDSENY